MSNGNEPGRGSVSVKPSSPVTGKKGTPKTYSECIRFGGTPEMCRKAFPKSAAPAPRK